jgi:uncharacterized protein (DUF488 family)
MAGPLYTVGHSTRSAAELIALLAGHGVAELVDVRRYPGSRRHPQFSREALAASLAEAGIGYRHEPDLGGRRAPLPDSPNTAWQNAGFRGYADHMATPTFRRALERLLALARERPSAVLCAEAVPWRCHRNLLADAAVAEGMEVLHLLGPGQASPHRLHPEARPLGEGKGLVYPAPGGAQLPLGWEE